mgnify:CR=1 FL=1
MKRMTLNAAELDKFIILNDEFSFQNETLEQASQHEPWCKIVEVINSKKPVLVFDKGNIELYIGNTDQDSMFLATLYNNNADTYTLTYDRDTDQLRIEEANETFISEDNVKTLFGNQSILGTGNIDLYRHWLQVKNADGVYAYFEFISSSNINATGNGAKLKDLLKCSGVENARYYSLGFTDHVAEIVALYWPGSSVGVIQMAIGTTDPVAIVEVKDTIETI